MQQAYQDMVDSGVDWIGDIPAEWQVRNIKTMTTIQKGKKTDSSEDGMPVLDMDYLRGKNEASTYGKPHSKEHIASEGDILVLWDGSKAGEFIRSKEGIIGSTLAKINTTDATNLKYFYYLLKSQERYLQDATNGMGIPHVDRRVLQSLKTFNIGSAAQQRIADFLDAETAKIDNLIAEQEKLLQLLEEKRRATITHAVTRGLNPNVELKQTKFPWLGQIPAHWNVKRIKYLFKIQKRIIGEEGPDILSITQSGIKIKDIKSGEGQLAQYYSKYQIVETGDFAMNHMDLLTGYVDVSKYNGVTSPDYRVFTQTNRDYIKKYYLYIFQQCYKSKIFFPLGQGSAQLGRWRLPAEAFNNFHLPVPPIDEQSLIIEHLDIQQQKSDMLKQRIQTQITLLKERRTSLISHAVTGKIKV